MFREVRDFAELGNLSKSRLLARFLSCGLQLVYENEILFGKVFQILSNLSISPWPTTGLVNRVFMFELSPTRILSHYRLFIFE
tara:strand:+ start:142 stop:390 length:249 start_codon:yes stop_codon:yes gene_type:complete